MEQDVLKSRTQLSNLMFLGGILGLIFGLLHLSTFLSSGSSIALSDAGINAGLGVLDLLGGWLVRRGRLVVILVASSVILASLIYAYVVGRGFNIVSLVLGGLFLAWIVILWKRGGLS